MCEDRNAFVRSTNRELGPHCTNTTSEWGERVNQDVLVVEKVDECGSS
jgi:hypothetical protein